MACEHKSSLCPLEWSSSLTRTMMLPLGKVACYCVRSLSRLNLFSFSFSLGVGYLLAKYGPSFPTQSPEELDETAIPQDCPGIGTEQSGYSEACEGCPNQGFCASGETPPVDPDVREIANRLSAVERKILILSGKGGVGKSTVATQLAWMLQEQNQKVGLMDIDVCGPSIPRMTGTLKSQVHISGDGWSPIFVNSNFSVMSIGYLLENNEDAVIWRGPKKNGLIKQFLLDVDWGHQNYLLIDTPPGTSDEHLSVVTYLKEAHIDGAIIVTTPQEVALQDVRKEINFCKKTGIPILGVIENMTDSIFSTSEGDVKAMTEAMDVPYLGTVPLDQEVLAACEKGQGVEPNGKAGHSFRRMTDLLLAKFS